MKPGWYAGRDGKRYLLASDGTAYEQTYHARADGRSVPAGLKRVGIARASEQIFLQKAAEARARVAARPLLAPVTAAVKAAIGER